LLKLPFKDKKNLDYWNEKYSIKEQWSLCFQKTLPSLKVHTTSRIEGLNELIKKNINLSTSVCELFHSMLKMHENILSKIYPSEKKISFQLLQDLEKLFILNQLKNHLSIWAYEECALTSSKSWNFDVKMHLQNVIFTSKLQANYEFLVKKPKRNEKFICDCMYYLTMGLPCVHMFSFARFFPKQIDLINSVRNRWLKFNSFVAYEEKLLLEVIEKELLPKSSNTLSMFF